MTKNFESGNAKNVANFEKLIEFVTGYGTAYNPMNAALTIPQLVNLLTNSQAAIEEMSRTSSSLTFATATRETTFEPLNKYVTKVINALVSLSLPKNIIGTFRSLGKKINGTRISAQKTEEEIKALEAEGKTVKKHSASQQSYDNRLSNFQQFINLLYEIVNYAPNEEDLKVATLEAFYTDLKNKNRDVATCRAAIANARNVRDNVLFGDQTGMVVIANAVKAYVKALFGGTSQQYKQVSAISFRNRHFIKQVPEGLYHAPTP